MRQALFFTASSGNTYLYSPFRNQVLISHPLLQFFQQSDQNQEFSSETEMKKPLHAPGFANFSSAEVKYQLKKYRFLKKHGYFRQVPGINLHGKLYPGIIEENLGNLKQVIFEVTEACNLSCTYCTFSKFYINKERGHRKHSLKDARTFLDFILSKRQNPSGQVLAVSFYGGEPLNNFRFIRDVVTFLDSYKRQGYAFKYNMSSNGLLLYKHIGFLVEHEFETAISLDGDEIGNSYRRLRNNKASFNLVTRNLDKVRSEFPEYFDKYISFLTVLHNKNSYPSVYKFFHERYQKIPLMSSINTLNLKEEYKEEFQDTFLIHNEKDDMDTGTLDALFTDHPRVKSMADFVEKYSGYYHTDARHLISAVPEKKGRKKYIPTATCLPFSLRVFLSVDGTILPCEHIPRIFDLGKFEPENIYIDSNKISQDFNIRYEKIRPLCEKCYIHDHCKECIFNTRIETDHPECDFFTDEKKFIGMLSLNLDQIESTYTRYLRILKEGLNV